MKEARKAVEKKGDSDLNLIGEGLIQAKYSKTEE